MSDFFRNTLSPGQWALLAAVPPAILALYFLKLKRVSLEVPSTYLWAKSIEDLRVNSLWQRLRQSILLLMQLLVVALAILALLRPGWLGTDLTGQRLIFLVDNSASMSTEDAGAEGAGERSRLDVAKEKVGGLIDQMDRGMTAMIISFADTPRVVQEFTDNTRLLRERLATIEPTASPTDLLGALDLAAGLATPARLRPEGAPEVEIVDPSLGAATVFILSDGRFGDVKDFALGNLDPVYVPLGSPGTGNLAFTALQTRRSEAMAGGRQAFVQLGNFSEGAVDAVVELRLDGKLRDAQSLAVEAGGFRGLTFPLGDAPAGALEARLATDSLESIGDRLAIDNRAYAGVNDNRANRVLLVTPGNIAVEQALVTPRARRLGEVEIVGPDVLGTADHKRLAAAGAFDLVIYDRCVPTEMPRSGTVFIGVAPPLDDWLAETEGDDPATVGAPQVIDWNRAHPLLAHIELGNFDVVESLLLRRPPSGRTLIDAAEGPIAAIAPRDGFEDACLGFAILVEEDGRLQRNTDWINRHSFPTFWLNVLEYFAGQSTGAARSVRPGAAVELKPISAATRELTVTAPDGSKQTLRRRGEEPFVYQATAEPGVYRVAEAGEETERFAVNLFDRDESDVRLRTVTPEDEQAARIADLRIGNIDVAAAAGAAPARQEFWRPLLVTALLLLVLEWYVYHRRVYV